jgi:hypothetical protein
MFRRGDESDYGGTFATYVPDLLERAPIEEMYATIPDIEREMVSPDEAAEELEYRGVSEGQWDALLELSGDEDDTRAYILIAKGVKKRSVHVLNANLITLDAMTSQDGIDMCIGPVLRQPEMQTPVIAKRIAEIVSSN